MMRRQSIPEGTLLESWHPTPGVIKHGWEIPEPFMGDGKIIEPGDCPADHVCLPMWYTIPRGSSLSASHPGCVFSPHPKDSLMLQISG